MFIKKIIFNENLIPFKKSDKIIFGGQGQIKDLISFYTNDQENAKRFKINCILANNGGGKSRFFEAFEKYFLDDSIIFLDENDKEIFKKNKDLIEVENENIENIISKDDYDVILDDFFVLSNNKDYSVNKNLLDLGYKGFYLIVYNFLNKNKDSQKNIEIFSKFIHVNLSDKDGYSIEISFQKNFTGNIYDELMNKFIEYKHDEIDEKDFKIFINNIYFYKGFGGTITDNNIYSCIKNIRNLIGDNNNLMLLITTGYLKHIFNNLINSEKTSNHSYNEYSPKFINDIINENEELQDLLNFSNKNIQETKETIKKIYDLWENIKFSKTYEKGEVEFSYFEIEFLSNNFHIDLRFKDYNNDKIFDNLSGGEKSMLVRFTNIYMKILSIYKKNFVILIDEPDLHLHLDWQRQYIQKLIDVFSTIDKNIKMHFILATHSPFIISDLPNECIVLFDKSEKNKYKGEFTEIKKYESKSFGANYVDLIRNGFFFENKVLMGSFAEKIIGNIAENELKAVMNGSENFEGKELKNQIGDEFLRDNLLYFKVGKDD